MKPPSGGFIDFRLRFHGIGSGVRIIQARIVIVFSSIRLSVSFPSQWTPCILPLDTVFCAPLRRRAARDHEGRRRCPFRHTIQLLCIIRETLPCIREVVHGFHRGLGKLACGEQSSYQLLEASLIARLSQSDAVGDLQEFALAEHAGVPAALKVCSAVDRNNGSILGPGCGWVLQIALPLRCILKHLEAGKG